MFVGIGAVPLGPVHPSLGKTHRPEDLRVCCGQNNRLRRHLLHGIAQPEPEGVELEPVHMLQHAGGRMGKIRHQIRRKEPIERRAPKGSTAELLHQLVLRGLHTRGHFR